SATFADYGRVADEQYVWDLVVGSDGRIYGGTYPHALLFRFDTGVRRIEILGRADEHQQYARRLASDGHGFVYIGVGSVSARIVAFEVATGRFRDVTPPGPSLAGFGAVRTGVDGAVYGSVGDQRVRLDRGVATPIGREQISPEPER